jgi:hypothetical protein
VARSSDTADSDTADLTFTPDPGIRVDNAALPAPSVDASGAVYLFYEDNSTRPPRQLVATSTDGLSFPPGTPPKDWANDPRRLLLPDGTWRLFLYDPRTAEMRSASSTDGAHFISDPGVRYRPQPMDNGTIGVYDHFSDSTGSVVLLYIGDMRGVNNVRRATSTDNGWTFIFDRGNVLGDADAGGGPNSYVDQKSIRLPDGRRRLFTMKQGTIYSFISKDDGKTFALEPGIRLAPSDFTELKIITLHDPWVVRLKDGRYRMYVAAAVDAGPNVRKFVIVSATTPLIAQELPFGPFHLPDSSFGPPYTGAFRALDPATANATLDAARKAGFRLIINLTGSRRQFQEADGAFSLAKFKALLDGFRAFDFAPYVADGTVIGHMLFDEPQDPTNWNGKPVPFAEIEAAAAYSKQLFPALPVGVAGPPSFLQGSTWRALDFGFAQYTTRRGDVATWAGNEVNAAQVSKLGLVLSINVLSGNNGAQVTADQLLTWGTTLAREPSACALLMWKYDEAYFGNASIASAVASVAQAAKGRSAPSCQSAQR